jgi:hypothetical protein
VTVRSCFPFAISQCVRIGKSAHRTCWETNGARVQSCNTIAGAPCAAQRGARSVEARASIEGGLMDAPCPGAYSLQFDLAFDLV